MPAVAHDLHAIRPPAQMAVAEMPEAFSDALRRNGAFLCVRTPGALCQGREAQQAVPASAPRDGHGCLRFTNPLTTSLHGSESVFDGELHDAGTDVRYNLAEIAAVQCGTGYPAHQAHRRRLQKIHTLLEIERDRRST